jgi:NADH:ubiquinone oxidoreductase subunit E
VKPRIKICMGSSCFRRGNRKNLEFIEAYLEEHGYTAEIELSGSRCEEKCRKGPNLEINGQMYQEVSHEMLLYLLEQLVARKAG